MKKRTLRLMSLAMALCMLLSGCAQPNLPDPTDTTGSEGMTEQTEVSKPTESEEPSKPTEPKETEPLLEVPEEIPEDIPFVKDAKGYFRIVYSGIRKGTEMKAANLLGSAMQSMGVQVNVVQDLTPQKNRLYEIVVGQTIREKVNTPYQVDRELLGEDGYQAEMVDGRLFLSGGDADSTFAAVEWFIKNVLQPASKDGKLTNFTLKNDYLFRQLAPREYPSIIAGADLNEYVIACPDLSDESVLAAAEYLEEQFVKKCGVRLEIVASADAQESPKLLLEKKECAGVEIKPDGKSYVLSYNARAGAYRAADDFLDYFCNTEGKLSADGKVYDYTGAIWYEDYGAKGDGEAEDSAALKAAHDAANAAGKTVMASAGATYYIGGDNKTVTIQTDTDWRGASFTIDDRNVVSRNRLIFDITSKLKSYPIYNLMSLKAGADNVGITFDEKCLLVLVDQNIKQYIRRGANQNSGNNQAEVILVHPDGTIDPSTPLMWDYKTINTRKVYPIDKETLTVRGGTFTTIANEAPSQYTYYDRGIRIMRSNTVVKDLTHLITNEGATGAPYNGFINVWYCDNVLVEDCVLSGHTYYMTIGTGNVPVEMGTYDIAANYATNLTFKGCTQANDYLDRKLWGIMGTNYCKSLSYVNCVLSRFDAHMGVANASIIGSKLGRFGLSIIGTGTLLIEDSTIYGDCIVNLRSDYGSTWDGDVIIRNCVFAPETGTGKTNTSLISGYNDGTHYFGYDCYLPQNVIIDGLTVKGSANDIKDVAVFADINPSFNPAKPATYPIVLPQKIEVRGFQTESGAPLVLCRHQTMFKGVQMEVLP